MLEAILSIIAINIVAVIVIVLFYLVIIFIAVLTSKNSKVTKTAPIINEHSLRIQREEARIRAIEEKEQAKRVEIARLIREL